MASDPDRTATGRLGAALRWPLADKLAFTAALVLMMLAAVLLRLVPIRHLLRRLGRPQGGLVAIPLASAPQLDRARRIRGAVRRAAMVTPLRADCLPQALVAAVLCRALGVPAAAYLGVRHGEGRKLEAHAWLRVAQVRVCGGEGFDEYTVVACFGLKGALA